MSFTVTPEDLKGGEVAPRFIEFEDGFELEIRFASAADQRKGLTKKGGGTVTTERAISYWLDHITDWRGISLPDGEAVPYSRESLRALYDQRSDFGAWLIEVCQSIDNFRD
jgi:hypothetical protein